MRVEDEEDDIREKMALALSMRTRKSHMDPCYS